MTSTESVAAEPGSSAPSKLRPTLGPVMLWGLGVGYVISGEYFGWNLGLPLAGSHGMLLAMAVVTLMYVAFVFSYAELACALPRAGGAFVYAHRALGRGGACFAGVVQILEFVFAPPAIAMAIGAYVHQRWVGLDPRWVAAAAYLVFTALNVWGVRQAAVFELLVTVLAVAELLVFIGVTAPAFRWEMFSADPWPHGLSGALAALPFAIWFYLAIEGVANAAEEARHPQRDVAKGFGAALLTLVGLAVAVFFTAVGVAGWRSVVHAPGTTEPSDAPLPLALAHVVPASSWLYQLLLGIGLLGLVASFHGILLAAGRATFEFGRSGFAPRRLGQIHARTQTPVVALVVNAVAGLMVIAVGKTAEMITLAALGALCLYIVSMASLIVLRRREPQLPRPFRVPLFPYAPATALGLAALSLTVMVWQNPVLALVFGILVGLGVVAADTFSRRHPVA